MSEPNVTGLTARNLSKSFADRPLWHDLSFDVEPGSLCALVGRSGSGKSTLLNCLGLLEKPDAGHIALDGRDITGASRRRARLFRRDHVGYLFQNYALIEAASVRQNLAVVTNAQRDIHEALKACGLAGREGEPVFRLSGGEQQRVAMARVLLKRPALVLADEPTGALDAENAAMIVAHLQQLATEGSCVVVATHSSDVAAACTRVLDLDDLNGSCATETDGHTQESTIAAKDQDSEENKTNT